MNYQQLLLDYQKHYQKTRALEYMLTLARYDALTIGPKKAVNDRSLIMGYWSIELFNHNNSAQYENLINNLEAVNYRLTPEMKRTIYLARRQINQIKKIDPQDYRQYSELLPQAQVAWENAKQTNDFSIYAPYLEKIIFYVKKFATANKTVEGHLYNTLLDQYEEGLTIAKLDDFFNVLSKRIIPLLRQIEKSSTHINDEFLNHKFPIDKQKNVALFILNKLDFDLSKGVFSESAHPFTSGISPNDIRLTTHYYERNLLSSIYSTAHEAGHGIYEQNINAEYHNTVLGTGASMAVHESQSRFYENIIGRSSIFTSMLLSYLNKEFNEQFIDVNEKNFYHCVNKVTPSLIRTDADELTYSLHIMIRYELEKMLIGDQLQVSELPDKWNELYKRYLNITPYNDQVGVLQDVHWSGGAFGYFPSYALGNAFCAQFVKTMEKDLIIADIIKSGNLIPIKNWLTNNIYVYGKLLPPFELLKKVTKESLNPNYFCQYLEEKFKDIYQL
jgi:carboxypeptidase Taq